VKKLIMMASLAAALVLAGCSSFVDSILDTAFGSLESGETTSSTVEPTPREEAPDTGRAVQPAMPPAVMQAYVSALFTMVYYHGGYSFGTKSYKPGEWTRWSATGMEQGEEFEKALLAVTDEDAEWWQIIVRGVEDGEQQEIILEALLTEAGDEHRQLLRLRALFPGDEEPMEIAVDKDAGPWHMPPTELPEESLEGAKKGKEKVKVPAGTFNADHVVYRDPRGVAEWWLAPQVPGGIVKYSFEEEGETAYAAELQAFGKKAQTRLESY
jgi:hypothetical protein